MSGPVKPRAAADDAVRLGWNGRSTVGDMGMKEWIEACEVGAIEQEDVLRFDHGGQTFAIYRSPEDAYFATDGLCTHEKVHLADGLVIDDIIECPKHNGRFCYKTGEARGAPVCVDLRTYPTKLEAGKVLIRLAPSP
jgi:3-phenylpropionate/trans-cinnamate dioxygenase ferredoxin subunit